MHAGVTGNVILQSAARHAMFSRLNAKVPPVEMGCFSIEQTTARRQLQVKDFCG